MTTFNSGSITKHEAAMKKSSHSAALYLRFLQLVESISGLPGLPALDPLEERILTVVANAHQGDQRLSVRDVLGKQDLGAAQTIHTRLKSMQKKGWISLADTEDARRKQVELTQAAFLQFERLSACMAEAADRR